MCGLKKYVTFKIMKAIDPLGYYYNGFVVTDAPGCIMYSYPLIVLLNQKSAK